MTTPRPAIALIVGAGSGLSASLARLFSREGMRVAIAARNTANLAALSGETGAQALHDPRHAMHPFARSPQHALGRRHSRYINARPDARFSFVSGSRYTL